jgi:hypothetical protein
MATATKIKPKKSGLRPVGASRKIMPIKNGAQNIILRNVHVIRQVETERQKTGDKSLAAVAERVISNWFAVQAAKSN